MNGINNCNIFSLSIRALQMVREEILDILGRKCKSCRSKKRLEIHHILPYWLWRYVGRTDEGVFSTKFLSNYEVLCRRCHMERHRFFQENLHYGFRCHHSFKINWNRRIGANITHFTYEVCVDESGLCNLGIR